MSTENLFDVFGLANDYSRYPMAYGLTMEQAKGVCKRDTATMFWPQGNNEIFAANKHREAIHVIIPALESPRRKGVGK